MADYIDLDDASLESEEVPFDPDADPFAGIDPVPAETYLVKLAFKEGVGWDGNRNDNGQLTSLWTQLVLTIADGDHENRKIFDMASTMVNDSGTNKVAGILKALGYEEELKGARNHQDLAKLLGKALLSEPTCHIDLDWIWKVNTGQKNAKNKDKYKVVKRGMVKNAKQRQNGTYDPILTINGEDIRAQEDIIRYKE